MCRSCIRQPSVPAFLIRRHDCWRCDHHPTRFFLKPTATIELVARGLRARGIVNEPYMARKNWLGHVAPALLLLSSAVKPFMFCSGLCQCQIMQWQWKRVLTEYLPSSGTVTRVAPGKLRTEHARTLHTWNTWGVRY